AHRRRGSGAVPVARLRAQRPVPDRGARPRRAVSQAPPGADASDRVHPGRRVGRAERRGGEPDPAAAGGQARAGSGPRHGGPADRDARDLRRRGKRRTAARAGRRDPGLPRGGSRAAPVRGRWGPASRGRARRPGGGRRRGGGRRGGRDGGGGGGGGSAADAQHMATEYVVRYSHNRRALPAIALTTDTSLLTACGNDLGFDEIFARQIEALARPGDLVVLHSTSGESPSVVRAAQ